MAGEPSKSDQDEAEPTYDINSMVVKKRAAAQHLIVPKLYNNWTPEFLDLLPFADNICVSYANLNILKGTSNFGNVEHPYVIPGLANLSKDGLTKNCILALSCSYFGKQHQQTDIVKRGSGLYGAALKELNQVLGDPTKNRTLEVFEAIMVLTLYEVCQKPLISDSLFMRAFTL